MQQVKLREPKEAIAELKKLRDRYKDKPDGQRLTAYVVMQATGLTQPATVSRWYSGKHEPQGATLLNLCKFLDQAKSRAWLEKFIKENSY